MIFPVYLPLHHFLLAGAGIWRARWIPCWFLNKLGLFYFFFPYLTWGVCYESKHKSRSWCTQTCCLILYNCICIFYTPASPFFLTYPWHTRCYITYIKQIFSWIWTTKHRCQHKSRKHLHGYRVEMLGIYVSKSFPECHVIGCNNNK